MAWQEVFPLNTSHIDAEEERELRLAAQARAGAEWALSALVARYQPPVTRYLTRLTGDAQIARLLAERIFVQMEKRLHGPHAGEHLRLWLLRACTEAGLDTLRHPHRSRAALRLDSPRTAGLLPERAGEAAAGKLRAGLGALANLTGSTSRQVRQLIWSNETETPQRAPKSAATPQQRRSNRASAARKPFPPHLQQPQQQSQQQSQQRTVPFTIPAEEDPAQQDPREALRFRMVRAVLAEIPYGDAQCLALHLIAGLNQAEVARALGITHSATRRRIVQGLQLFAQRYEAAAASLGLSMEALSPAVTRPSPSAEAALPLEDVTALTTAPLPEPPSRPVDAFSPPPVEEPRTVVWDTPFMVMRRATPAPATSPLPPQPEPERPNEIPDVAAAAESHVSDAEQTLILDERGGQPVTADEEKTLVIVETTAVVDATPVIELPLADTAILRAPEVSAGDDAVALELAAVEVAARPPEGPVAETEPEWPSSVDASAGAPLAAEPFVPMFPPASATVPLVRVVPVLTSAAQAPVERSTPAEPGSTAEMRAATREAAAHAPHTVRVVPVLTPVTPIVPADPVALDERPSSGAGAPAADGDEVVTNILDARRKPVALPMGTQDGATVEAHVEAP